MLDIKFIIDNKKEVQKAILHKKIKEKVDLDVVINLYYKLKNLRQSHEELQADRNKISRLLQDPKERTSSNIQKANELKNQIKKLEIDIKKYKEEFDDLMLKIPNVTDPDMPIGRSEDDNVVVERFGNIPSFDFEIKDHTDLGESLDILEIGKARQVSGARFYYLKNDAVLMQFALINFVLDTLQNLDLLKNLAKDIGYNYKITKFIPVIPPVMIRPKIMKRMDRLDPIEERYELKKDKLVLVGSAEHTLGPILMDEKLNKQDLPIRLIGYSTAFRREAGSYGKDVRGILRTHQFDKLEMETYVPKDYGKMEQKFIVEIQKYLVNSLEIPFRVIQICTGDTGKPDYNQFDIECWIPSQNKYRETHTSDYMTDFQSRRLNIRYFDEGSNDTSFVHMNDATAFAIGRILIAIWENYQQRDGSIVIPNVLRKYIGKEKITKV